MFTSNINEYLLKTKLQEKQDDSSSSTQFLSDVKTNLDLKESVKSTAFNYENIKSLSYEDIETLYENEDDKSMAKNLKLAVDFTDDKILGKALFDTVLGKPFQLGYSYLLNSYEDKHNYFLSKSNKSSLGELLLKSVSNGLNETNKNISDKVSQDYLDEILLEVNSFNFLDAMSSGYKDAYGRYKNEYDDYEDEYSFLYNDFALKYEELKIKYEDSLSINKNLIKQF